MRKSPKRLTLSRETVRHLAANLEGVAGGIPDPNYRIPADDTGPVNSGFMYPGCYSYTSCDNSNAC